MGRLCSRKWLQLSVSQSFNRPITITHVVADVFERLLAKGLNNFAEKKNLFLLSQFGFF